MSEVFDRLKAALADDYAIEPEIRGGGMATVYVAEDLTHHRKVALKAQTTGVPPGSTNHRARISR